MEAVYYTKGSKRHKENQDAFFIEENNMFYFFSLADGVSSRQESATGAKVACRTAAKLLMREDRLLLKMDKSKATVLILNEILYNIKKLNETNNTDIREYASTLMFVLIDKISNELYMFNLGDGVCAATSEDKCFTVGTVGKLSDGCYATTTANVEKKVLYEKSNIYMYDTLLLMTDGAWESMYDNGKIIEEFEHIILNKDYDELKKRLYEIKPDDDCTFIAIDLSEMRVKGEL